MADALEAQRAAYAAGQIVPTLQMAGNKRLEPVAIGKAAQELAAKKAREVALTSGGVPVAIQKVWWKSSKLSCSIVIFFD